MWKTLSLLVTRVSEVKCPMWAVKDAQDEERVGKTAFFPT